MSYGYRESHGQRVTPTSLNTQQLTDSWARGGIRLFDESPPTRQILPRSALQLDVFADIGEEIPADEVIYEWRVISGPGTPVFTHPTQRRTSVVLDMPGVYAVEMIARSVSPLVDERILLNLELFDSPPLVEMAGGSLEIVETALRNYRVHTFSGVGVHAFEVLAGSGQIEVLVVAGGGGGGGASSLGDPHQGGKGGSGIVIVRVPMPTTQAIPKPGHTRKRLDWPPGIDSPNLYWTPEPDAIYVILASTDLVEWRNTGEVFHAGGTAAEILHTLPPSDARRGFYRLVEIRQSP